MFALAILCQVCLRIDFAPIALAAVSSSGTPLSEPAAEHGSPVSLILISLVVILTSAKLGGALIERIRQPAVLGELIFGGHPHHTGHAATPQSFPGTWRSKKGCEHQGEPTRTVRTLRY